jgi:hypothetical protein
MLRKADEWRALKASATRPLFADKAKTKIPMADAIGIFVLAVKRRRKPIYPCSEL